MVTMTPALQKSKPDWIDKASTVIAVIILTFVFAPVLMLLWNWVGCDLFDLPVLGYWKAWGVLVLARLLCHKL